MKELARTTHVGSSLWFALLLGAFNAIPQFLFGQALGLRFDHISTSQGLSQDIVTSITQDGQGFMWFGTEDGLNRYDGYSMKVYKHDPRDSTSVSLNSVNDIYEDTHGRLWIATSTGLNLFDRERDRFLRFVNDPTNPRSLSSSAVTTAREDRHGNLWVATPKGLNRYIENERSFVRYFHDPAVRTSVSDDKILTLTLDTKSVLWISTANGICSYDETTNGFKRYLFAQHPSRQRMILQLYEDRSGRFWAIHAEHGVWLFDPASNTCEPLPVSDGTDPPTEHELAVGIVNNIAEDSKGRLWFGHFNGLDVYDPDARTFTHYSPESTDPSGVSGRVMVSYRDKGGVMWLGTFQGGVDRCDPSRQKFLLYRNVPNSKNCLVDDYVTAIVEDRSEFVWIGTANGLDRFDPKTNSFLHFRHDPRNANSLNNNQVNTILEDSEGNLWIGTGSGKGSSLDRLDRERKMFAHYPITSVKSLLEDSRGILWIGKVNEADVGEDILRMDLKTHKVVARDSITGTGVWCIYEDRQGLVWLGGQYCCLNRYDRKTGRYTLFEVNPNRDDRLSSGAVRTIYEDPGGFFWFGTWGGGLNRYEPRPTVFTYFIDLDGLPSNYVKGILPDGHGNLWVSTEKGLSRFGRTTHEFRNFTTDDGLQGDRFLSNSCLRGKNGWMYFGGTNGLNAFHPDSIRDNPNVPPVVVTSFKVFDRPFFSSQFVSSGKEIHLAYEQDFLSFEFVALDYTAPQKNRYAYKLEGFDHEWVNAGTRRYAAYTQLSPGEYVFRVRGSNNDGVWNNNGASVKLIIAPPYWMTWWFRVMVIAAVAGVLYLLYRTRIKQLLAIERLRSRIASDLHDDVGTDLSTIVLATQSMVRKVPLSQQEQEDVRQIGRIALRTQDMMRDIVWVLNSRNDSLADMILKMREVASRLLKEISYSFKGPDSPMSAKVDLEFKRNVFLFYKECLNNIVKHSAASVVKIEVEFRQREFILKITDNGRGFDPELVTAGMGLQSLRARALGLGGNLSISSRPESGTEISLIVKTPQMRHGS